MKLFSALLVATLTLITPAHAKTPGEVDVGSALRDLPMQGLNGPSKKVSDFRGKPLIINVWASWCGPCRAEMGSLDRLAKRYGKQFTVIGISTDDYPENAKSFLQKSGTAFPMFIDDKPWPLENMLGANRLPLTVLIDADGKVLGKYYGAHEWDSRDAVETIAKVLKLKL
ncbi:TlpA family protein disulfide reductase [Dechloromonas sp. XY25]|uniref:TlpA family protein disulfide reductase n=1 Tax=Dechloromonas hankyongensis TaxID=2908002 RepID=A0ABS9K4V5_9RHOO|nr:TlpA disulfide reductase family protein [Dechloromonas hankyongensis]MCG2578186.1 TlpA family protein disulfide reductase [Dechloromonas hankyongensis]